MREIILLGTFHFPGKFDIFSKDIQSQVEDFTEKLALLKPNKIAVEYPYIMQDELDNLYEIRIHYTVLSRPSQKCEGLFAF